MTEKQKTNEQVREVETIDEELSEAELQEVEVFVAYIQKQMVMERELFHLKKTMFDRFQEMPEDRRGPVYQVITQTVHDQGKIPTSDEVQ